MRRYKEVEFDVLEAIMASPAQGLYFAEVLTVCSDALEADRILKKFVARNYLTQTSTSKGAYFSIKENNQHMTILRVRCPVCKTMRRTHREDQFAIHCKNPNCTMPSGRHRVFWLVNIDHLRNGVIRRINQVHS